MGYSEWLKTWKCLFLTEQMMIVRNKGTVNLKLSSVFRDPCLLSCCTGACGVCFLSEASCAPHSLGPKIIVNTPYLVPAMGAGVNTMNTTFRLLPRGIKSSQYSHKCPLCSSGCSRRHGFRRGRAGLLPSQRLSPSQEASYRHSGAFSIFT